jgi:hypothetical protein
VGDQYPRKVEQGEGGVRKREVVPDDVVETRLDQDDDDTPDDDGTSTPVM